MEIKGKKVVFLGDSITEGAGASKPENRFTDVFGALTGAIVLNHGIGGSRIAPQEVKEYARWDRDYVTRVVDLEEDADLVVVFGGTNDFGHGQAPFGELSDTEPTTFCGACRTLFERLLNKYPTKPIAVLTPLHRLSENVTVNERGIPCKTLKEYVDVIKTIAEEYSLPLLDLWACSGMQPKIDVVRENLMPDGLHPSDLGHAVLARKIAAFVKTL